MLLLLRTSHRPPRGVASIDPSFLVAITWIKAVNCGIDRLANTLDSPWAAGMEAVAEALASAVVGDEDGTGSDAAAANDDDSGSGENGGRRKRRRTAGVASGRS